MQRILVAFAVLAPLAPAQTDAGLWRFVHPNAKALIGIDVHRIKSSTVAAELSAQLHALPFSLPLPVGKSAAGAVSDWMSLIDSVDRMVVSSPGRTIGPDANAEPPLLIAISGHFEPVKLSKMFQKAGCRPQTYRSITVYRPQDAGSSDFGFVVLNSQTLLLGDAKSIFETIDRLSKSDAAPPPIVARARDLDVAYDFWAVLLTPPSAVSSDRFPFAALGAKITGVEAGIALRDGFAMDLNLNTFSEAAAKEIASQLSKFTKLAAKDRENHPEWSGIDRKLRIRVDRADVHFTFRLTDQDVARMAKAYSVRRAPLQIKASGVTPASATTLAPQPPRPQVIRIDGLDSGPRDIPYTPPPEQHR